MNKFLRIITHPFRRIKNIFSKPAPKTIQSQFLSCGNNVSIGQNFIGTFEMIEIGEGTAIGPNCVFYSSMAKLTIGKYVMISPNVTIITGSHKTDVIGKYMIEVTEQDKIDAGIEKYDKPVVIEDDVWIGANVLILKGVTIGRGSIIHAGQVITKSIPPYTIYVNDKVNVKRFSEEEIIEHEKILRGRENGSN